MDLLLNMLVTGCAAECIGLSGWATIVLSKNKLGAEIAQYVFFLLQKGPNTRKR